MSSITGRRFVASSARYSVVRDAALSDDRARWVNVKRQDGKAKRRFRWNHKPSRKYLQVIAQLRRVERKRIKTLQAEEHRITTEIVRNHQVIAIEDTAIINMTRSARGTAENPGKNVAQKRGLNRSILSQRWAAISPKLEYKSRWYGRQCIRVPAAHTSQTCPACGHVDAGSRFHTDKLRVREMSHQGERGRNRCREYTVPWCKRHGRGRKSGPRASLGEPPYPQGIQATHKGPSTAPVAVHKNANLVPQFYRWQLLLPPLIIRATAP